jgi:DNA (cytosine-5)-methyltransferase 1
LEDFFQFSVFDTTKQPFKIDKPIRLIELFAGIGSQAKALERLGIDFEHYRICEFDKYAVASYNAVHETNFATSDITKITAKDLGIVDTYKYLYMMTYSFPCQDLSLAGKQKGMAKGDDTRSGLLWEVERLLNECTELPQVLLMENVTQVHGTKNKEHFDEWIKFLESKGYSNYWKDLNAKNFGIPQNRNRTFMVSVLGNYTYEFPKEFPLELRLKDMLEDSVDEKFYISNANINKIINQHKSIPDNSIIGGMQKNQSIKTDGITTTLTSSMGTGGGYVPMIVGKTDNHAKGGVYSPESVSRTIMATDYKQPMQNLEPVRLGGLYDTETSKRQAGAIWDKETIAPTVDTMQGGNRQPLIVADERFFKQALETVAENDCSVGDTVDAFNKRVNKSGVSPTITTRPEGFKTAILPVVEPLAYDEQNGYIRKDGIVGTLTTDGSSPKHNNRVVENCYVSEKGVRYICDPSRGMATDVNADVCQPLTAKGQSNWTGSFISPDIESLEKSSTIGSTEPTKINLKNGEQITSNDNVSGLRIRKLTPKECWRLMGFDDADFEKASQFNSNAQLYKQAGNSIVVDVLYYIFRQMI